MHRDRQRHTVREVKHLGIWMDRAFQVRLFAYPEEEEAVSLLTVDWLAPVLLHIAKVVWLVSISSIQVRSFRVKKRRVTFSNWGGIEQTEKKRCEEQRGFRTKSRSKSRASASTVLPLRLLSSLSKWELCRFVSRTFFWKRTFQFWIPQHVSSVVCAYFSCGMMYVLTPPGWVCSQVSCAISAVGTNWSYFSFLKLNFLWWTEVRFFEATAKHIQPAWRFVTDVLGADFPIKIYGFVIQSSRGPKYQNIIKISKHLFDSKYQNIGFIDADFSDQGIMFQDFSGSTRKI